MTRTYAVDEAAPAGTVVRTVESSTTTKDASVEPNRTFVALARLTPERVSVSPASPIEGVIEFKTGSGSGWIRPMRYPVHSANQRAPSGPVVMPDGNDSVVTEKRVNVP